MHLRSSISWLVPALAALSLVGCSEGGEAQNFARSSIERGNLENAESVLAGVWGVEADELRARIAAARAERTEVEARIEAALAGSGDADAVRAQLEALRNGATDVLARGKAERALDELEHLLAKRRDPEGEERAAAAEAVRQIGVLRAQASEALTLRDWRRVESVLYQLAEFSRERVGDLSSIESDYHRLARQELADLQQQTVEIERSRGPGAAREWLAQRVARFPRENPDYGWLFKALEPEVRRDEPLPAIEPLPGDDRESRLASVDDGPGAELRVARALAGMSTDQLVAKAGESAGRDELELARQCWIAASLRLFPGDVRDDYLGEAQDLAARLALRNELAEAFGAAPERFAMLGVTALDDRGWTEAAGELRWREVTIEKLRGAADGLDLSPIARRGLLCEALRGADSREREKLLASLAEWVADGDIAASDAASLVARARGGLGAKERFVLDRGQWVARAKVESREFAEQMQALTQAFVRAGASERDAAFDALVAAGDETSIRSALLQRTSAAFEKLSKDRTTKGLLALAELRRDLDAARKSALDLIFDENVYFYPYAPPEPPHTAGEYAKAQQRVDERVSAVREAWDRTKTVKVSKDFATACEEVEWCLAAHRELHFEASLPDDAPEFVLVQSGELEEFDLASFAWTAREARTLATNRAVVALNERHFEELDRAKDIDAALLPNVAEREQVRITNRYRTMMGRRALAWNPRIQVAAQGHSEYMANTGDFGHFEKNDPARYSPFDRMRLAGYDRGVSENCAMVGGDPQAAHDGWLHSSGHHRNILMDGHREMASGNASNYWTQNFGTGTEFEKELAH